MKHSTILHTVKQALRHSGYPEDAEEALGAYVVGLTQNSTKISLKVLVQSVTGNSVVYLEHDQDQKWTADY